MRYFRTTILRSLRSVSRVLLSGVLLLGLIMLPACSSVPRELTIKTAQVTVKRPPLRPAVPDPLPVKQAKVDWKVLTAKSIPAGDSWVYFGVTPRDYEKLSENQADVLRFIKEAMWRLRYYRGDLRGPID